MSDIQIGLIAEGPTDKIIIEAALNAILPASCTFVISQLQPESTTPQFGGGWGGVLKWCDSFAKRKDVAWNDLSDDPTLSYFDMLIIHIDADVTSFTYQNVNVVASEENWKNLPMTDPDCPQAPINNAIRYIEETLLSWLNVSQIGDNTVMCVPSKNSEAWLACAILPSTHPTLASIECHFTLETVLKSLPRQHKVNKTVRDYQSKAPIITSEWKNVKSRCFQAQKFESDVQRTILTLCV